MPVIFSRFPQWLQRRSARSFGEVSERDLDHYWLWFGLVLSMSAGLRFWNLAGPSIWMDEGITLGFARLPLDAILFDRIDNHPPLSFLVQNVWMSVFPDPALARVPVALTGIATVGVLMALMRDLQSQRAAILTGLLLAVTTGHIYYSQEARMYAFLVLGCALAAWGGIGHANPGRLSPRAYGALYVIGGAIAIYSHLIGLLAMALIGLASLAVGVLQPDRARFARDWCVRNLLLFTYTLPWLVQIPGNLGFPGLNAAVSLHISLWSFKTVTAYPGIGELDNLVAPVLFGLVAISVPVLWVRERRALALVIAALAIVYPVMLFSLSLYRPILSGRTLIPAVIGICMGAGAVLALIRSGRIQSGLVACLALAGFMSSFVHLRHSVKPENHAGAFQFIAQSGYAQAPVLTCIDMSTAAAWEAGPTGPLFLFERGGLMRYPGPGYWQAARMTMARYSRATASEVDSFLGGGLLIPGGMAEAFAGHDKIAFVRPFCEPENQQRIDAELAANDFIAVTETRIMDGAPGFHLMVEPKTRVTLFVREPGHSQRGPVETVSFPGTH